MIDILGTIQKARLSRAENFLSIIDLFDYIKETNVVANFADIADYFLIKLSENNPRTTTSYDYYGNEQYESIGTYYLPNNLEEKPQEANVNFFVVVERIKSRYIEYISGQSLLGEVLGEVLDKTKVVNFIDKEYEKLCISRKQIEKLLNITIPIDNVIIETYKQDRLFYLTGEITKLDENYFATPQNRNELNKVISSQSQHITDLEQQLSHAQAKNAELLVEVERLKEVSLDSAKPCYLNKFVNPDPLAIAIEIRNTEWKDFNPETDAKKSATQIKNKIKRNYQGISDTLAEMVEKVACPIDRTRNK